MTDKSYPPPCRVYLKPLYLSVTLYACAQRVNAEKKTSLLNTSLQGESNLTQFGLGIGMGGGLKGIMFSVHIELHVSLDYLCRFKVKYVLMHVNSSKVLTKLFIISRDNVSF